MLVRSFEYRAPASVGEACKFLSEHPEDSRPLAGGQSLIPLMRLNLVELRYLVDLKRIESLRLVSVQEQGEDVAACELSIGSMVTHDEIEHNETIRKHAPLLSETARSIGHPLVRNRGTIGGSVSHCDPSADYCASLLTLDASVVLASVGGTRTLPCQEFFVGPFTTAIAKGEIVESIRIPINSSGTRTHSFKKLSLGHGSFPLVVVSVSIERSGNSLDKIRIGLAGVSDKAIRAVQAERLFTESFGKEAIQACIQKAAATVERECNPSDDLEVSGEYKRKMAVVLTRRALTQALGEQ